MGHLDYIECQPTFSSLETEKVMSHNTDRLGHVRAKGQLTTIPPPLPLPFPLPPLNARSQARAFAGLNYFVKLPLADWDGHAGVAVGVLGFADLRREGFVLGGGGRFGSFEKVEHYSEKEGGCGTQVLRCETVGASGGFYGVGNECGGLVWSSAVHVCCRREHMQLGRARLVARTETPRGTWSSRVAGNAACADKHLNMCPGGSRSRSD